MLTHAFEFGDEVHAGTEDFVAEIPAGVGDDELDEVLIERLRLPWYYGCNWNALSECVRDFHWIPQHTVVIHHRDLPPLDEPGIQNYVEILAMAQKFWAGRTEHKLRVIFPEAARARIEEILQRSTYF